MADFNTHVFSAAATGSLAATLCMKLLGLSSSDALVLTLASIAGGVLPDIDLKYSTPGKALFSALGVLLAMAWLFANIDRHAVLELWAIAIGLFLVVRYPLWWIFHQFTVHRGALHSLAACLMFSLGCSAAAFRLLTLDPLMSWLTAAFLAAGFALHLVLDEVFAVDFLGARINHRFGSALKIIDTERLHASCLVLFAAMLLWFWTPPTRPIAEAWSTLQVRSAGSWVDALVPLWAR